MRYQLFRTETVERYYTCPRCGTRGTTFVRAHGSAAYRNSWFDDNAEADAREVARMRVQDDATRILGLVRCPGCNERAPGAVGWSIVRFVVGGVPAAAGFAIALPLVIITMAWWAWLCLLGAAAWLATAVSTEGGRWREATRARLQLTGVTVVPSDKSIPKAIARELPAPVVPVVPVASAPPPRDPEPPADGEGPRFLRDA